MRRAVRLMPRLALAVIVAAALVVTSRAATALPPRRVVTLEPSLTETVCALDACDRLVAIDRYSDWPAAVQSLPRVGSSEHPEIEAIVRLRADLVLLRRGLDNVARLRSLGVETVSINTQTYGDVLATVEHVATLLGDAERGRALRARIERETSEIGERQRARRTFQPRVYFEVDRGARAAGEASYIGELLLRLGAKNIVGPEQGPFPKLNPEYVVRENPDVLIVSPDEAPDLERRPGWASIRGIRERRICTYPPETREVITRPGPRVAEAMSALATCLDRFAP